MKKEIRSCCGVMAFALIAFMPLVARTEDAASKLDSLFRYLASKRGFNGNVLVAQNGKVIYKNALGYADLKTKKPLNLSSVFQIASVTKQFTATAIMMLHDEGKLEFSDSVSRFIPEFPYKSITIRHLLTHTSGIPEYMYFASRYWPNKRKFLTNKDILEMYAKHKPKVLFKPEQRYRYSNSGYAVLAGIVERISGLTFGDFVESRIFRPVGMNSSYVFNAQRNRTAEDATQGHNKNRRRAEDDYLSGVVGDKGIFSTVEDMLKWDQALYSDILVKQSTLEEAFSPKSYDKRHRTNYGYGWRIDNAEDGEKVVYHAGWWRGYNSLFVRRLADKTAIVVLSNKVNWSFRNVERLFGILDSAHVSESGMQMIKPD